MQLEERFLSIERRLRHIEESWSHRVRVLEYRLLHYSLILSARLDRLERCAQQFLLGIRVLQSELSLLPMPRDLDSVAAWEQWNEGQHESEIHTPPDDHTPDRCEEYLSS